MYEYDKENKTRSEEPYGTYKDGEVTKYKKNKK